ncbi:MAG: hypothetical protein SCK29_02475 [Bacillota bacterium]|nr:hypothetical protein [Bacillota bacterium]MDW7682968.1 hypothetical protein [Bacillota bacterium]
MKGKKIAIILGILSLVLVLQTNLGQAINGGADYSGFLNLKSGMFSGFSVGDMPARKARKDEVQVSLISSETFYNHNHDSSYADIGHNHDSQYSLLSHNHDSRYAPLNDFLNHNHDLSYADIGHNHDSQYSLLSHNHDSQYAPLNDYALADHTHSGQYISSVTTSNGINGNTDTDGNVQLSLDENTVIGVVQNNIFVLPLASIRKINNLTYEIWFHLEDRTPLRKEYINNCIFLREHTVSGFRDINNYQVSFPGTNLVQVSLVDDVANPIVGERLEFTIDLDLVILDNAMSLADYTAYENIKWVGQNNNLVKLYYTE